jgi:glycogen(starch) synthase
MSEKGDEMPRAVVLTPCEFSLDPRHGYWSRFLRLKGFDVIEVEVLPRSRHWNSRREMIQAGDLISVFAESMIKSHLLPNHLSWLVEESETSTGAFLAARTLRHLNAVNQMRLKNLEVDLVIANDLGGVLLAEYIWANSDAQIVYDAQEVFTDSYDVLSGESLSRAEKKNWIDLETFLCGKVSRVVTVSPGIARLYLDRHQTDCVVIPNFVPTEKHMATLERTGPVKFVYLGRAEPYRGLEELVKQWDFPPEVALLDMIIPQSSYTTQIQKLNSRTKRRFCGARICSPVYPNEIIGKLNSYDVGILPYNYPYPYSEASPNKLGEYIAAGLVVIASNQSFVSSVVDEFGIGLIFSWEEPHSFGSRVNSLTDRKIVNRFKDSVLRARSQSLNFDAGCEALFSDLMLLNLSPRVEIESVIEPLIESGRFVPSCWRWVNRFARNLIVRHLRLFGPLIKVFGRTSIGRSLAR